MGLGYPHKLGAYRTGGGPVRYSPPSREDTSLNALEGIENLLFFFFSFRQRQANNFVEAVLAHTNVAYLPDKFAKLL